MAARIGHCRHQYKNSPMKKIGPDHQDDKAYAATSPSVEDKTALISVAKAHIH